MATRRTTTKKRTARVTRKTRETSISAEIDLDGTGKSSISTGVGFLDHMLELLSRHSLVDMKLKAKGDLEVDYHHTVEDLGLVLGEALDKALGTRRGIRRYGDATLPMDESLGRVVLDLGGRPFLVMQMTCRRRRILDFDLKLIEEFFRALTVQGRMSLHITQFYGADAHHSYEVIFKAMARALRTACERDPRDTGVPSSKGTM